MKRMDRYKEEISSYQTSRSNKNQELYQNIGSNVRYASFSDVENANAYELGNAKENYRTREGYQKYRDYQDMMPLPPMKKELEDFNHIYKEHENKVYDINSVLESARENRVDKLDEKRKLKNDNYNIFSKMNKTELDKFRKERLQKDGKPNEELREFIDTITSKTLAGEISKEATVDLLSDLMATNVIDKVEPQKDDAKKKELNDIEDLKRLQEMTKTTPKIKEPTEEVTQFKDADTDFYTRSMDLSEKDFNFSTNDKESTLSLPVKIFLFIVIIIVSAIIVYLIYQFL